MTSRMTNVGVTNHAVTRAVERFGIPKGEARLFVQNHVKLAKFIGIVQDINGRESRLYAYKRMAFHLAVEEDVVLTVLNQHHAEKPLRKAVESAVSSVMAKMDRKVSRKGRSIDRMKAELKIEIGERELERQRTKSKAKRMALTAYINALNEHFGILDGDLAEIKREQSTLRKGVVAYV
jgi:hypothetical protein